MYADWLEQRGAAKHAKMVRLGVERAAIGMARATFGAIRGMRLHTARDAKRAEKLDDQMRTLAIDAHQQKQGAATRSAKRYPAGRSESRLESPRRQIRVCLTIEVW